MEIGDENEASESTWNDMFTNLNYQTKLVEMIITIGRYNECGDNSMKSFAASFRKIVYLKKVVLIIRGDNNIS